jgi:hypothetical protein
MRMADHITLNYNNNMLMASVFSVIEKAFNRTWHSGLLYKLSELEFSTSHIKLIASFLTDRKFKDLVEGGFFCAKKTSGRASTGFCPCRTIVQSIHKCCLHSTWISSCILLVDNTCIYATYINFVFSANCNKDSLQ